MKRLNRRSFLAAWAAMTATMTATMAAVPALGAPIGSGAPAPKKSAPAPQAAPRTGTIDVVIVGAGAAGIAAARRLAAAGRRFALIEAAATVGGRCITDTTAFGIPFRPRALLAPPPGTNPLAQL